MTTRPDLLLQILGLLMLGGGLWLGYGRWVRPHSATLDFHGRGALLLVITALMGGFIGSFFWWMDEARSFAWDLPPLASRMLAAAGWSFAVVCYLALQRPSRQRIRLVLLLLAVYLAPLVFIIFIAHLDVFDFTAPITYAFFVVAGGMTAATLWYLWRFPASIRHDPGDDLPARTAVQRWLMGVGGVTAVWGLALFVTDNGPVPSIWAWPGDLLTSRLIGVMLLTIATGAAVSWRYASRARLLLAVTTTYGLGLALASLWNLLADKPIKLAYLLVFGGIFLGSALLLATEARPAIEGITVRR